MYPNVPTRRVGSEVLPYSVNFVSPKSATCTKKSKFWNNESYFSDTIKTKKEKKK